MKGHNSLKVTQGGIAKTRTKGSGSRLTSVFHSCKPELGILGYRPELLSPLPTSCAWRRRNPDKPVVERRLYSCPPQRDLTRDGVRDAGCKCGRNSGVPSQIQRFLAALRPSPGPRTHLPSREAGLEGSRNPPAGSGKTSRRRAAQQRQWCAPLSHARRTGSPLPLLAGSRPSF